MRALPWPRLGEGYLSPGLFILLGIPRDFDGGEGGGYDGGEPIGPHDGHVHGWLGPHDGHVVCRPRVGRASGSSASVGAACIML